MAVGVNAAGTDSVWPLVSVLGSLTAPSVNGAGTVRLVMLRVWCAVSTSVRGALLTLTGWYPKSTGGAVIGVPPDARS